MVGGGRGGPTSGEDLSPKKSSSSPSSSSSSSAWVDVAGGLGLAVGGRGAFLRRAGGSRTLAADCLEFDCRLLQVPARLADWPLGWGRSARRPCFGAPLVGRGSEEIGKEFWNGFIVSLVKLPISRNALTHLPGLPILFIVVVTAL